MAGNFHLLHPRMGEELWALPFASRVPAQLKGRKLPNGTILVKDETLHNVIWKLTPWEKTEKLLDELAIYARLLSGQFSDKWVRLLGVSAIDEHFARAYEYAPFGDLPRFLRENCADLTGKTARHILTQIAAAMAALHAHNIIHRDLKAENILVFNSLPLPEVKLADFDRAYCLPRGEELTEPVGSLFHMAPELLSWQNYDHRVDIYAFGMLIFEVVGGGSRLWPQVATGMPNSLTAEEFAHKVIDEGLRPQWPAQKNDPDYDFLHDLALRCLVSKREDRPEFSEVYALLEQFPKSVKRFSDKNCGENKQLEQISDSMESHSALTGTSSGENIQESAILSRSLPSSIGMAASIGCQRRCMEDAVCVLDGEEIKIMAIFDGFNGHRVSGFAAASLALIVSHHLKEPDIKAAITKSFTLLHSKINRLDSSKDHDCLQKTLCGSTATLVVFYHDQLYLAFLGDSPAFTFGKEGAKLLNQPHHPDLSSERERIVAAGGTIQRETKMLDNGELVSWGPERVFKAGNKTGLALTRALGALPLKPIISSQEEIVHRPLSDQDEWLILCSDGVSGMIAPEEIQIFCQEASNPQQAAVNIIKEVERLGAPDNASIIIAKLK